MPVPESGEDKEKLLRASDEEVLQLENQFQVKRSEVVDNLIENTCWSTDLALQGFVGRRGTNEQRLKAVLVAFDNQ